PHRLMIALIGQRECDGREAAPAFEMQRWRRRRIIDDVRDVGILFEAFLNSLVTSHRAGRVTVRFEVGLNGADLEWRIRANERRGHRGKEELENQFYLVTVRAADEE